MKTISTAHQYINVGNTFVGVIERPDTEPIEVALPLKFPTIDKMRKGVWI